jgi:5'-3' exonuclease
VVYLIDASVYVFRAWHAWQGNLTDTEGNPTHALHGFGRFLLDVLERRAPGHIAVAFDESLDGGMRRRIYPRYKCNREPAPLALRRQFGLCRQFCRHMGVAEFASSDYEADDLIGTLAARCRAAGLTVTIVSCDKDLAQLIGPGDVLWDYSRGSEYRYEQIAPRFGVRPERIADYLALRGDSVDNVPGVPGIGPKTAATLMGVFASLEELFDGLERVAQLPLRGAERLSRRLHEHRDSAYLARALTRISCDAPLAAEPQALARRAPDLSALASFCAAQGFGAMLPRQAERLLRSALSHPYPAPAIGVDQAAGE